MTKKSVSPEFIAALQNGAVPEEFARASAEGLDNGDDPVVTADQPNPANSVTDPANPANANAESPAVAVPVAEPASEVTSIVSHLRTELKEAQGEVLQLKLVNDKQATKISEYEGFVPSLCGIVKKASEVMAIALGTVAVGLDSMSPEALCNYHRELSSAMAKKFPIGGVARKDAEPVRDAVSDNASPARLAAVNSSNIR